AVPERLDDAFGSVGELEQAAEVEVHPTARAHELREEALLRLLTAGPVEVHSRDALPGPGLRQADGRGFLGEVDLAQVDAAGVLLGLLVVVDGHVEPFVGVAARGCARGTRKRWEPSIRDVGSRAPIGM